MVRSRVTVPQLPVTVSLYVRVVAGVTTSEPLTGTDVAVPVARSVMDALEPSELVHDRVEDDPALTVVAVAEKVAIAGAGVTVTVTVRVTLPAPFETVRV